MEKRNDFCSGLILILCVGIAQFYVVTSNPIKNSYLFDNEHLCADVKFIQNSSYLTECNSITYPPIFVKDDNLAMCVTVYDIANKICVYESKVPVTDKGKDKLVLPKSVTEFDAALKKLEPKPNEYTETEYDAIINKFCINIESLFANLNKFNIQSNKEVEGFIDYANNTFGKECRYACHQHGNLIKPLCTVFVWANQLLNTVRPVKTVSNTGESVTVKNIINSAQPQENSAGEQKNDAQSDKKIQTNPTEKQSNIQSAPNQLPVENEPINIPIKQSQDNSQDQNVKAEGASDMINKNKKKKDPEMPEPKTENKLKTNVPSSDDINKGSKQQESIVESPSILQPEDGNPDDISGEEQNKKNNDNEPEEINEHDNIDNNLKESANNLENQYNLPQEGRKSFYSPLGNEEDESHFFAYISVVSLCFILLYVGYHNKQKILAMALEGRRGRRSRGSRRRPSTASYRKLDSNLEEAVTSQCNSNVTHVIY